MSPQARRAMGGAAALGAGVVAVDQAVKALVEANLELGQTVSLIGPVDLTLSYNSGVAFGLASGAGLALTVFTVAALGLIGALFARNLTRPGVWVAAGLMAGGAIGNLIDRVASGHVTDYVDILAWPAFNLADVAITAGIALMAAVYLRDG